MFKIKKTQFAIRKLAKGAAAVLLSFGIFVGSGAPLVSAATQAPQTEMSENTAKKAATSAENNQNTDSQSATNFTEPEAISDQATANTSVNENPAPKQTNENSQINTQARNQSQVQTSAEMPVNKNDAASTNNTTTSPPVTESQNNSQIQNDISVNENTQSETQTTATTENQQQTSTVNQMQAVNQAEKPTAAPTTQTETSAKKDTSVNMPKAETTNKKSSVTKTDNQKDKITIKNDKDLASFIDKTDISQLDATHHLGIAGAFHLFGEKVNLKADTNGNIAAGNLNAGVDFGTRGESHNHTSGDIYYIENIEQIKQNGFRNPNGNYVVFGKDVKVEIKDGKVIADGVTLDNLKPDQVKQYDQYIDIQGELENLSQKADKFSQQAQTEGVKADFTDMNNKTIDVSGVKDKTNTIYITVDAEHLRGAQPLYIKGLTNDKNGPAIILNVVNIKGGKLDVGTQIKLNYQDNSSVHPNEAHANPNKLLWNFGTGVTELNFNSGYMLGSVLATNATISANVNVDGNIIGKVINISGGESHRWDLNHPPLTEIVVPEEPKPEEPKPEEPEPDKPTPEEPKPEEPEPDKPTPEEPKPEEPEPDKPTPEEPKPEEPKPDKPTPEEPKPEESIPEQSTPEETEVPKAEETVKPTDTPNQDNEKTTTSPKDIKEVITPLAEKINPNSQQEQDTTLPKSAIEKHVQKSIAVAAVKNTKANISPKATNISAETNSSQPEMTSTQADLPAAGQKKDQTAIAAGTALATIAGFIGTLATLGKKKRKDK